MGWWWNSSSPKEPSLAPSPSSAPQQPPSDPNTSASPPPPPSMTREEQADLEFKKLLASLEGDINSGSSKGSQQTPSTGESGPEATLPPSSIAPESLYPDTMSCRSAFDYAFFCQSFGGQFVNVYRYGELRSCSEHWDNFWLCMKTRTWSDGSRKAAIREHNRKKAIKFKTGPSSEDVWDLRMEPARNAFDGDFVALEREMKAEEEASGNAGAV